MFTDANAIFELNALEKLVQYFDDPSVGYTVGCQLYRAIDQDSSANSENVYWNMELKLKEWESDIGSVVGGDGAIYALRRELFEPLAAEDINDFILPLKAVVKGYRGVFEPGAICYEYPAGKLSGEFRRKLRIVNRSMRAVLKCPASLNPNRVGVFAIQLFCHKVLRWLIPFFLLIMLTTSSVLAIMGSPFYIGLLALQLTGYVTAGLYAIPALRQFRIISLAYYFLVVNAAAAVGLGLLLTGKTISVWNPQRQAQDAPA